MLFEEYKDSDGDQRNLLTLKLTILLFCHSYYLEICRFVNIRVIKSVCANRCAGKHPEEDHSQAVPGTPGGQAAQYGLRVRETRTL